jgi:transposase
MHVAAELGIQPSMLRNWRAVINGAVPRSRLAAPIASPADQVAAVARLRRELDRARAERDILKKAIGIFSGTPR